MSLTEAEADINTAKPKRVLVVDSQPNVALFVRKVLEPKGMVLRSAETGAEARRLLAAQRFDLAMISDPIPDEPFDALILHLRQAQDPPPRIMFLCSRENRTSDRAKLDALFRPGSSPDFFVTKPFSREELWRLIEWQIVHNKL